jgi:TrmH RNA methyltransferase
VNACLALFSRRPGDVVRVHVTTERIPQVAPLLQWCAAHRKAYHVVTSEDLDQVTGSMHHEGICILSRARVTPTAESLLATLRAGTGPVALVGLEDVENPHNVGAILRVCAHFGVPAALALGRTPATLSTAVHRTSEGGAESVDLVPVADPLPVLAELRRAGFVTLAASHRSSRGLYQGGLPPRLLLLLGAESTGLSRRLLDAADASVAIPGSGVVESLNVACATTALLGEHWRLHR